MVQFRSALTQNDLVSAATVACTAGQFTQLGKRVIQAGELLSIGFGEESGQNNAQGRMFMDIRDNTASPGAVVNGTIRLSAYTPQMRYLANLGEWRTETLRAGSGDRTKQVSLNESMYALSEDKILALEFNPDTTSTIGKTNTIILIDTTEVQA